MDFTFYGTPFWLSDEVIAMAKHIGFELIDKFIYTDPKHKKLTAGVHATLQPFPLTPISLYSRKNAPLLSLHNP